MRIGIFFGGNSREREISFAGGRTVYDNLNKSLFTAVPFFVDSIGNIIELDWQFLYKGTIRDFYPPVAFLPESANNFQIYIESIENLNDGKLDSLIASVGKKIEITEINNLIDFAFLALHGQWGEDGQLQGLLENLKIPYSGSGIRASSIGMDKSFQKKIMNAAGFISPEIFVINRKEWLHGFSSDLLVELSEKIAFPLVVRPANQGSSIGVSIVHSFDKLAEAVDAAFFIKKISFNYWKSESRESKIQLLRDWTDIRYGTGFPMNILEDESKKYVLTVYHPEELLKFLDSYYTNDKATIILEGHNSEQKVLLEGFIEGREFSCVVIQDENGIPVALPPTEIVKGKEVFDYRSKYLAGLSRKITPIDLAIDKIEAIRRECERLFNYLEFNVYARIDGFIKADGTIILNDPNTTSGMLPSSFFFHQAAEIGLNPSQFLTYIIWTSVRERIKNSMNLQVYDDFLEVFELKLKSLKNVTSQKKKVAVILGGYSSERHISLESGRNIFEKLSSSINYEPIPIFLTGDESNIELYQLPINLLLKDNADDIREKIKHYSKHPLVQKIQQQCSFIREKFSANEFIDSPVALTFDDLKSKIELVFIALHGRPGEDGFVQSKLDKLGIPYNGSSSESAALTINKYETLQKLKRAGFKVTDQMLILKSDYYENKESIIEKIENNFVYPFILKPIDDGCSSAVKKIKNKNQLKAFLELLFRQNTDLDIENAAILNLKIKEEFPQKEVALIEKLIEKEDAVHFLEITGGLLTRLNEKNEIVYEQFEPSETLAGGEVLTLEEKFLAGEGQNITPARFAVGNFSQDYISHIVRNDLEKVAKVLNVSGYARIDAFVRIFSDGRVETIVIEVNSLPGMTPATCIFHQCALKGYSPSDFIGNILEFAERRSLSVN